MSASYQDLRVWQDAMDLVENVYCETQGFPKEERYGLTSQMRRAAVSIPSNIAEGKGRSTDRDRSLFFCHARGSLLELETQILIAERLKFLAPPRRSSNRPFNEIGQDAQLAHPVHKKPRKYHPLDGPRKADGSDATPGTKVRRLRSEV